MGASRARTKTFAEGNAMVIRFAQRLPPQEITRNTGCSLAMGYAIISMKNRMRGHQSAGQEIEYMARNIALKANMLDQAIIGLLLWGGRHWLPHCYQLRRHILGVIKKGLRY